MGIALALCLLAGGCKRSRRDAAGEEGTPIVFLLSSGHAARAKPQDLARLGAFLRSETGLAVEVRVAGSPEEALEAFRQEEADVGLLPMFQYILARARHGATAGLQAVRNGQTVYSGEIYVRVGGGIARIEDLQGRKVAFVDRYSVTGYILPSKLFADAGVQPVAEFAGSHARALALLRSGQVIAAATHQDAIMDAELRVLATTEAMPSEPVFFRRTLDAAKRVKLKFALMKFADTEDGRQVLGALGDLSGFSSVSDEAYRHVYDMARAAGVPIR